MSKELQKILKPGDQIIAIEDARFPAHISKERHYSQRIGDILMVNNPRAWSNSVGGTHLNGHSYDGRPSIGLGGLLNIGTFRMATPDDPGFMATRAQWADIRDAEIRRLRDMNFVLGACLLTCIGLVILPCLR
jgi:hypothetical protein